MEYSGYESHQSRVSTSAFDIAPGADGADYRESRPSTAASSHGRSCFICGGEKWHEKDCPRRDHGWQSALKPTSSFAS